MSYYLPAGFQPANTKPCTCGHAKAGHRRSAPHRGPVRFTSCKRCPCQRYAEAAG